MAQMTLTEIFTLNHGGAAPNYSVSRGLEAANLNSKDPREVWLDVSVTGSYQIDIDLGVAIDWDLVALINVSASSAASWAITGGTGFGATSYLPTTPLRLASEDGNIPSGPARFWSPNVINGRYIRLTITPNGGPLNSIGRLIVGKSWKPSLPREFGAGRPPVDTGSRTRLDNGGLATVSGHLLSGFKWVFADLEPADLKRLWGMYRRLRTTEPWLLDEDPAEAFAENVHYCTFIDLEAYERNDASKSRMVMTVEDVV
jgi:hypothetical protein